VIEVQYLLGLDIRQLKALLPVLAVAVAATASAQDAKVRPGVESQAKLTRESLNQTFIENRGQWDSRARFMANMPGGWLWITNKGFVIDYRDVERKPDGKWNTRGHVVRMDLIGASAKPAILGKNRTEGITAFINRDKLEQTIYAPRFTSVEAGEVYPGIDLKTYYDGPKPRYDFVVAPGADPNRIRFRMSGAKSVRVDEKGDLVYGTSLGDRHHRNLFAYQTVNGEQRKVEARYVVEKGNIVRFEIGAYDTAKPLVIDPIIYGSYFGATRGNDEVRHLVSRPDGSVYMCGTTDSALFPVITGPYGFNLRGPTDGWVALFDGAGYSIQYNAYIGGTGSDAANFVSSTPDGRGLWLGGETTSADFPGISSGSFQSSFTGGTSNFVIRFTVDPDLELVPEYSTFFGTATGAPVTLMGMKAAGNGDLVLAGETTAPMTGAVNALLGGTDVFVTRMNSTGTSVLSTRYIGGNTNDQLGAARGLVGNVFYTNRGNVLALNRQGEAFLVGTVSAGTGVNVDTSTTLGGQVFRTTAGVFEGGRLIRSSDAWIAKLGTDNSLIFGAVIGGTDDDEGCAVATDLDGNAYVLGFSGSFDFPRTLGTFGQRMLSTATVTKVSASGNAILYGTGLETGGIVLPVGIGADAEGWVSVVGIVAAAPNWPNPLADPPRPDNHLAAGTILPLGIGLGPADGPRRTRAEDVSILKDTFVRVQNSATNILPTVDSFFYVLTPTAQQHYATYIGGDNNDMLKGTFSDTNGDIWVYGMTESFFGYRLVSSTGTITDILSFSTLPQPAGGTPPPLPHITGLAWKNTPDTPFSANFSGWDSFESYPTQIGTFTVRVRRDGLVQRFRFKLPSVTTVLFTPGTLPGGLGTSTTGRVTLSRPAPDGGAEVLLLLRTGEDAASFNATSDEAVTRISIPAGQTVGTFTVFTKPVVANRTVEVTATYEGAFGIGSFTVVPWLQSFTLTPSATAGGNQLTGRVTIQQGAPVGGLTVAISTTSTDVSFPNGTAITVPEGQTTATFPVATRGVATNRNVTVSATFLQLTRNSTVRLTTANLGQITFNPTRVTRGGSAIGTLTLDGEAGSTFTVDLSMANSTGYTITPSTLTFNRGDRSQTFTVTTPAVPSNPNEGGNTTRTVVASRAASGDYLAQSVSGTLIIEGVVLDELVVSPDTVMPNELAVGRISLTSPAPAGGATIYLFVNNSAVAVPLNEDGVVIDRIQIPAGSTFAEFSIGTAVMDRNRTAIFTAALGADALTNSAIPRVTDSLVVQGVEFTLNIDPTSVVGGTPSSGVVIINAAAPPGGITVNLRSGATSVAQVPASVTIPEGSDHVRFNITTSAVTTLRTAGLVASIGPRDTPATVLTVRPVGVGSISFSPRRVRGTQRTVMTVRLDAPAPAGGALVRLSATNPNLISLPRVGGNFAVRVPAGQQSVSVSVLTSRVARELSTTVSGSFNGTSSAGTVTVIR
jgi:hypothetical protein